MEISSLIPHIESLVFASDKPLTSLEITELINQAFGFMEDKVVLDQVESALEGIVEKYNSEFYPFEVRMSGGGWQFLTKKDYHKTVAQLNGEKFLKRLSAAALETLAIIAYKQPITKGEIESIRGVSSDYSVQKLLEKELIIISGRNEKLPGHPLVYNTSKSFMDYFGINSADDLPKIREVLADQVIQPTIINPADFETSNLIVTDEGELITDAEGAIKPESEEPHLNGHSFEMDEASSADELTEEDFPEEEQKEMEIEEQSDEIVFTSDEIEGLPETPSEKPSEDPLSDDDSPKDEKQQDKP